MSYWDTSCLIKLYTPEPDSALFRARLAIEASCLTADIAPLEFWATVRRKETEGVLAPGEAQTVFDSLESDLAAGEITLVPSDTAVRLEFHAIVEQCHAQQPPIFIRTNDALHPAAARCSGETKFVATHKRLGTESLVLSAKLSSLHWQGEDGSGHLVDTILNVPKSHFETDF